LQKGVVPTPFCQLFQTHGNIFKPHPTCDLGQTSMMRLTHRVFFFCVGKDTLDRSFAHGVDFFPSICSPKLLYKVQILLPDVGVRSVWPFFRSAHEFKGAVLAAPGVAAVSSFSPLSVVVCLIFPPGGQVKHSSLESYLPKACM